MSNLVERLQRWGRTQKLEVVPPEKLMDEAADEIERQAKHIEELEFYVTSVRKSFKRVWDHKQSLRAAIHDAFDEGYNFGASNQIDEESAWEASDAKALKENRHSD